MIRISVVAGYVKSFLIKLRKKEYCIKKQKEPCLLRVAWLVVATLDKGYCTVNIAYVDTSF